MRCRPTTHSTAGKTSGSVSKGCARNCQRLGASSSQATDQHTAIRLLASASHTVVAIVRLLPKVDCHAAQVKDSGSSCGNGQLPVTLPARSAAKTVA